MADVEDPPTDGSRVDLDESAGALALTEEVHAEATEVQTTVLRGRIGVFHHAVKVRLQVRLRICAVRLASDRRLEHGLEGLREAVVLGIRFTCSDQVVDLTVDDGGEQTQLALVVRVVDLLTLALEPGTQQADVVVTRDELGEHQRTTHLADEGDPVLQRHAGAGEDHLDHRADLLAQDTGTGHEEGGIDVVVVQHGSSNPA